MPPPSLPLGSSCSQEPSLPRSCCGKGTAADAGPARPSRGPFSAIAPLSSTDRDTRRGTPPGRLHSERKLRAARAPLLPEAPGPTVLPRNPLTAVTPSWALAGQAALPASVSPLYTEGGHLCEEHVGCLRSPEETKIEKLKNRFTTSLMAPGDELSVIFLRFIIPPVLDLQGKFRDSGAHPPPSVCCHSR
ncbi:PREDICTED: synapsin-1-like isoform X2 [Myotis brandtii]|uniref:synapsin-1-like isoform X2 n=1 Tax=Myotis brandtii TaxID=109478 RepID=UPI000703C646|nr:PREDICTED: synapsin-1-like isoform X2 [Myotis brandtii]